MSAAMKKIRKAVAFRAVGACEACGKWIGLSGEEGHLDHMQGRARSESVETCWLICPLCDFARTTNSPSATHWAMRMERHALRYGFDPEPYRVRQSTLAAKGLAVAS